MEIINKTMDQNSPEGAEFEEITLFTGRVLLIFYCLIFIFGLIGISKFNILFHFFLFSFFLY
jgi:hypothetical protein